MVLPLKYLCPSILWSRQCLICLSMYSDDFCLTRNGQKQKPNRPLKGGFLTFLSRLGIVLSSPLLIDCDKIVVKQVTSTYSM